MAAEIERRWPVLYLCNDELTELGIPTSELWRVVRFEVSNKGWISWFHENEWRCPEDFTLPKTIQAVFVRHTKQAQRLTKAIALLWAGIDRAEY